MHNRRNLLRLAGTALLPVAALSTPSVARADDGDAKVFLGTWSTIHTLPFPPGSFREFLTFESGGGVKETNSFLHTASNLDFSALGLPSVLNASDGMGNWERSDHNQIGVRFHKMLFDGSRRNFGDLRVVGTVRLAGTVLSADWQIDVVDTSGQLIAPLGGATSVGARLG